MPVVTKGERVLVGQKIGDSDEAVSAPILSSVSGTVKEIVPRWTPSGEFVQSVVVDSDGAFERGGALAPRRDLNALDAKMIAGIVREAGIVGMGGAAFPTHIKLTPPPGSDIRWIIANGAECEPYLNCDSRLMIEEPEAILGGLSICMKLFPAARAVIAIEDNKKEAIESMTKAAAARRDPRLSVMPHKTKYPQGAEKMLILTVTGQEIPPGRLPPQVGCLIDNVRTLWHIWRAVTEGEGVIDRIVTVSGDAVREPKDLRVPLGASVRSLIEACGGFKEPPSKVLSGGPMMGMAMRSLDVPVIKSMSGITALTEHTGGVFKETACIRCGRCVSACPERLMPNFLSRAVRMGDLAEFERLGGMICMECGSCAYICPARRYLVQDLKVGKAGVSEMRRREREREAEEKGVER